MSTIAVIVIVVAAILVVFFVGGLVVSRRRATEPGLEDRIAAADGALEHARAADRGWERSHLERAALDALAADRPGTAWERVALVLVDDRPGVENDRCHLIATGPAGEARVVLGRHAGGDWFAEQIS